MLTTNQRDLIAAIIVSAYDVLDLEEYIVHYKRVRLMIEKIDVESEGGDEREAIG